MIPVIIASGATNIKNVLRGFCKTSETLTLLAVCSNTKSLIKNILDHSPKVILISEKLNDSTGYAAILQIMKIKPTSVLIVTFRGMESIKVDYPRVLDYSIVGSIQIQVKEDKILHSSRFITNISILSKLKVEKFRTQIMKLNDFKPKEYVVSNKNKAESKRIKKLINNTSLYKVPKIDYSVKSSINVPEYKEIVVIGASTGGPRLLVYVISQFPKDFPPVLVVQHMPPGSVGVFADRMNKNARIEVKLAEEGDVIQPGKVYIAPGGYHMELVQEKSGQKSITITDGALVNFVKPAVDVTLYSVARIYKKNILAFILTGMGRDGTQGCRVVKKMGGKVFTLKKEDSVIYGMNKSVDEAGLSNKIVGMDDIVREIAYSINYKIE